MPDRKRKARRWFPVWCQALGNMLVYHFHRFSVGAYIILVLALVIAIGKIQHVSHNAKNLAETNRQLVIKNQHLVIENKHRIEDIQRSRVHSCKQTYESFRIVFGPFIRPKKVRTPKENADLAKFNGIIDKQKQQCVTQTKPKVTRP